MSRKKKIILTGDFLIDGISEKGLSVNHKVKIVNFPGGTSEQILEELDDITKEKSDDVIAHGGPNDIINNVHLSTNVKKKSLIKFLKYHHRRLSNFHLPLTAKTRRTSKKP